MFLKSSVFRCLVLFLSNVCTSNSFLLGKNDYGICKIQNLKPWIYFQYDVCVQLIINDKEYHSSCVAKLIDQLTANGISVYHKSIQHMKKRNILKESKTKCESFLLVMENPNDWIQEISQQTNYSSRIFYPFSRLYFFSLYGREFQLKNLTKYLYENAYFGYDFVFNVNDRIIGIRDLVRSFSVITTSPNFTDLFHPLIDTNDHNKLFKVSVFECPPHVIFLDKNGTLKDGLEYRFLTNVLKNWKITFVQKDEKPIEPFIRMFYDLAKGASQMAMCSVWLHPATYGAADLTNYFDNDCNTWIAPKPTKIDPAALIYLTLSTPVWGLYLFCFICTVILLTLISKIEANIQKTNLIYSRFGRSFLDTINTATSHGIHDFPKPVSVQILLMSWILLNLEVGLGYTTIYTSRLTKPGYTKPIDTYEDFADQGISWISQKDYEPILTAMNKSSNPAFNNMYKNFVLVNSQEQLIKALTTGRYGVLMSIHSDKYAVDIERITDSSAKDIWKLFRFMKVCFYNHYSTFAMNKKSPYTTLINAHIRKYQEFGFIKHWYTELYRGEKWMDTLFESQLKVENVPVTLTLWNMSGAFLVLIVGLLIASASCLTELIYDKFKRIAVINKYMC